MTFLKGEGNEKQNYCTAKPAGKKIAQLEPW